MRTVKKGVNMTKLTPKGSSTKLMKNASSGGILVTKGSQTQDEILNDTGLISRGMNDYENNADVESQGMLFLRSIYNSGGTNNQDESADGMKLIAQNSAKQLLDSENTRKVNESILFKNKNKNASSLIQTIKQADETAIDYGKAHSSLSKSRH